MIIFREDLDLWINMYRRNQDTIFFLQDEIQRLEDEINASGGIPKISKDIKPPNDRRKRELFFLIDQKMNEQNELKKRNKEIDKLIDYLECNEEWQLIVSFKRDGKSFEEIAKKVGYYTKGGIYHQYMSALKNYIVSKSHTCT